MLTTNQKSELERAIASYLRQNGYKESYATFTSETNTTGDENKKYDDLLSRKWVSVVRLQKKLMDLQSQVDEYQKEVKEVSTPGGLDKRKDPSQWLPRAPPRHTLGGHKSPITAVKLHPNFVTLATASEDATIKLWDFESGDFERTLKSHTDSVNSIDFDPSGKYLASSSADMTIKMWDFSSGDFECLRTLHGHDHNVSCVKFISTEILVSASRDKTVKLWATESGHNTHTLKGHLDWVRRAIPSPCGKMIASCSNDFSIKIWDLEKKEIKHDLREHEHVVEDVCWANSTSNEYIIKASSIEESKKQSGDSNGVVSRFVVSACRDKTIKFWDIHTSSVIFTLIGHDNWVRGLAFHPQGRYLISVSDDKTVKSWDIENKRCHKTLNDAHEHFVCCIDMHRKSNLLVTGSVDTKVSTWDCR
jgi:platelet-activating factor acetylhydrolase IB subunit alpha